MIRHTRLPRAQHEQERHPRWRRLRADHQQRAGRGYHTADPADLRTTADNRPRHGHSNRPTTVGRAQRSLRQ